MTMTLGACLIELRDLLDETTSGKWTDPQLRKWINEGCRDMSRAIEALNTVGTISVTSANDEYTLPAGLIRLSRVEYYESASDYIYPIQLVDVNSMQNYGWSSRQQHNGIPQVCTVTGYAPGHKLVLFPKPDQNATIRIYYYKLATELATDGSADATALDVPEGWWDAVKVYAEYNALRRDRDPRFQEAKALYDEKLLQMKEVTRTFHNQAGFVESFSGSLVPHWLAGMGDDW